MNDIIYEICELAHLSKEGHIGSSLSILNILDRIYYNKSKIDVDVDFVMSKGHASLGLYSILKKYGYIDRNQLDSFCKLNSDCGGHPDFNKVPGILGSTGSLGHGLPIGLGRAMSNLHLKINREVIVLIGDGELNEGSNWESFLVAAHHKINNLKVFVDYNGSSERAISVDKAYLAIEKLGWETVVIDGHDNEAIDNALRIKSEKPVLLWAKTIKGNGVSFMEGNPEWHHKAPTLNELNQIKLELFNA